MSHTQEEKINVFPLHAEGSTSSEITEQTFYILSERKNNGKNANLENKSPSEVVGLAKDRICSGRMKVE